MTAPPDKLSIILFDGAFDRVHYGLATASAALAIGRAVTLFFTMGACRALLAGEGWRTMPVPSQDIDASGLDARFLERGTAGFEELLSACAALGAKIMVCEMGLRAMGIGTAELRDDLAYEEGGLVTFLEDASKDGAMLFI